MKTDCLVTKLRYINSSSERYMTRRIQEEGLSILNNHIPLFYILSTADGEARLFNEIATLWNLSKSSLSDIINKYQTRGLIEKHICIDDKRTIYISLTKKGAEIKTKIDEFNNEFLELIMKTLDNSSRTKFDGYIDEILKESNRI